MSIIISFFFGGNLQFQHQKITRLIKTIYSMDATELQSAIFSTVRLYCKESFSGFFLPHASF